MLWHFKIILNTSRDTKVFSLKVHDFKRREKPVNIQKITFWGRKINLTTIYCLTLQIKFPKKIYKDQLNLQNEFFVLPWEKGTNYIIKKSTFSSSFYVSRSPYFFYSLKCCKTWKLFVKRLYFCSFWNNKPQGILFLFLT